MPTGIDHIVHAVRDLDGAAAFYERAGFTVGSRNRHPWGTHNRIVQLDGFYIELLEVAEPDKIATPKAGSFSFGAYNRDFVQTREGLSMLLLATDDAAADKRGFDKAGFGNGELFEFGREGLAPDGRTVKLAFTLAFAADPLSPNVQFASCQHHYPENFWNPAFQAHANGALHIVAAVLVAENPTDHHIFLKALTGLKDLHSSSIGVSAHTLSGQIEIMEPVSFRDQFRVTLNSEGGGMTLNGIRFCVRDLKAVEALLRRNGVPAHGHVGRVIVMPEVAHGATLIFEQAQAG